MFSEMPSRQSAIAGAIFCFLSTSMQRMSGRPAFTRVASWRVNDVRSFAFTLPRRNFGNLILMSMLPFLGAFAGAAFLAGAGFFAAAPPPFISPRAVGISPCALMAAMAPDRSPASTVPRRSWPELSFAIY